MGNKIQKSLSDVHDMICEVREKIAFNDSPEDETPACEDIIILPDDDCSEDQMKQIHEAYKKFYDAAHEFDHAFHDLFDCR